MSILHAFTCPGCGLSSFFSVLCAPCKDSVRLNATLLKSPVDRIVAIAPLFYSIGVTHQLFKEWKNNPGLCLSRALLHFHPELLDTLRAHQFDSIVPIPQHFRRSWDRGHASAMTTAEYFSKKLNIPIKNYLGIRSPQHKKQALLHSEERDFGPNNFVLEETPKNLEKILIVDDLITTGNTLARASSLLVQGSPNIILYAASLAYRPTTRIKASALITTVLENESPLDSSESSLERDSYSRFLNRI